jgi:hypothetical protein
MRPEQLTDIWSGTANISDMTGYSITDSGGVLNPKLVKKGLSIGAYQYKWGKQMIPFGLAKGRYK